MRAGCSDGTMRRSHFLGEDRSPWIADHVDAGAVAGVAVRYASGVFAGRAFAGEPIVFWFSFILALRRAMLRNIPSPA